LGEVEGKEALVVRLPWKSDLEKVLEMLFDPS
jgi:hypothetical protein